MSPPDDDKAVPEPDDLDMLLSRGRVGGPVADAIFEAALPKAAAQPRRIWPMVVAPLALAAASLTLVASLPDGWRVRGRPDTRPLFEAACAGQPRCHPGDLLVIRVDGVRQAGYLAAWAEPAAGGERVWYFPDQAGRSPRLDAGSGPQIVPEGVRIGAVQPPGEWRLRFSLHPAPMSREEILRATSDEQKLEVIP